MDVVIIGSILIRLTENRQYAEADKLLWYKLAQT